MSLRSNESCHMQGTVWDFRRKLSLINFCVSMLILIQRLAVLPMPSSAGGPRPPAQALPSCWPCPMSGPYANLRHRCPEARQQGGAPSSGFNLAPVWMILGGHCVSLGLSVLLCWLGRGYLNNLQALTFLAPQDGN